ncbi:MAG TPA: hypothetical protein VKA89_09185, partial [Solirubrobacterales bacterium]|nr:hypothetical protein [Solirubrobacterales bacterium]
SPSDWPRFHHDLANSGDLGRDATLPGKPEAPSRNGGRVAFTSPGDDLLCGTPAAYQLATSPRPIDESNFAGARRLGGAPEPAAAGSRVSFEIPAGADRYVAIRARDEQGNVGRVVLVDRGPGAGGAAGGPKPGRCANRKAGGPGPDRLRGTRFGDRLLGRGGGDSLRGFGGRDCLNGGRGRDRLRGGKGADLLRGGPGRDVSRGGPGRDVLRARDGRPDLVDCGRGRDRARVDREDVVRRCERVRRR